MIALGLNGSVDFASKKPVFLLAWRPAAAESAAYEEGDTEDCQTDRNPGSHRVEPDHERV
jgi:hypothetical protein